MLGWCISGFQSHNLVRVQQTQRVERQLDLAHRINTVDTELFNQARCSSSSHFIVCTSSSGHIYLIIYLLQFFVYVESNSYSHLHSGGRSTTNNYRRRTNTDRHGRRPTHRRHSYRCTYGYTGCCCCRRKELLGQQGSRRGDLYRHHNHRCCRVLRDRHLHHAPPQEKSPGPGGIP